MDLEAACPVSDDDDDDPCLDFDESTNRESAATSRLFTADTTQMLENLYAGGDERRGKSAYWRY